MGKKDDKQDIGKGGQVGKIRPNSHPDGWDNPTRKDDEPEKFIPDLHKRPLGGDLK